MRCRFSKMHGLGNDFVVIDGISQKISLNEARVRKLADRRLGVGCDQVLLLEVPREPDADFRYRIFNQDGSEVENCGNGARCIARFIHEQKLSLNPNIELETLGGRVKLRLNADKSVTVDMGIPRLEPDEIGFNRSERAITYPLALKGKKIDAQLEICAVSMGNPHAVLLVDNISKAPVKNWGPLIEKHKDFPRKVNAGFLQVLDRKRARVRVFERGVGETRACGTGACAAVVAGRLRQLLDSSVDVELRGGTLRIEWEGEGSTLYMSGPATTVYQGQINL